MLIISGSLPKSGSAWLFYLTNDLMAVAGYSDTLWIKKKFDLEFIKYDSCNIQEPTEEKLTILTSPPVSNYSFAVKTHYPHNPHVLKLLAEGKIKMTYIYRDPRDLAVSGLEAGRKLRQKGIFNRFGEIYTMKDALFWTHGILRDNWQNWSNIEGVLYFKYENLLENTTAELLRLCNYLEISVKEEIIKRIIDKHSAERLKKTAENMNSHKYHFNKAKSGRFREVMTGEQIQLCQQIFGDYLEKMGYSEGF